MPRCDFHPDVETSLRCVECDRYICPRDIVSTEVGYKCRECAAPPKPQIGGIKPRQLALSAAAALGAGLVGGIVTGQLLRFVHFFPWLFMLLFGAVVAEAARRGSGGHRTPQIAAIAVGGAVLGALLGGLGLFGMLLAGVAAALVVLTNRF